MHPRLVRAALVLGLAAAALATSGCCARCLPFVREDDSRSFAFFRHAAGARFDDDVRATQAHVTGIPAAIEREFASSRDGLTTASELYGGCHSSSSR